MVSSMVFWDCVRRRGMARREIPSTTLWVRENSHLDFDGYIVRISDDVIDHFVCVDPEFSLP